MDDKNPPLKSQIHSDKIYGDILVFRVETLKNTTTYFWEFWSTFLLVFSQSLNCLGELGLWVSLTKLLSLD